MSDLISVEQLRSRIRTTPQLLAVELLLSPSHSRMLELIDMGVDFVSQRMARNPELKQGHTEDELTDNLISNLVCLGFDASHDTKVGGHCDIIIEGDMEFLWLAEAKKFGSDYGWLIDGFNQLNTRYSTGITAQSSGALILYVFSPRIDRILERFADRLSEEIDEITVDVTTKLEGYITSRHPHQRTGAIFTTRCKAISLLWKPG